MDGMRDSVVSADGTRIGFVTAGDGPDLLLVHGGACSLQRWAPVWPRLTETFRVTAMDRRGRGCSGDAASYSLDAEYLDVRAVASKLAAIAGGEIDVLGHSYGATCVLGAAGGGAPFRRIALYEPPGPATIPSGWPERVGHWIADGQPGRAMSSFLVEIVGLSPAQVEALRQTAGGDDWAQIVSATLPREAQALRTADLPGLATHLRQPVLILLGSESPPWATSISRDLARDIPHAEIVVLDGHGHEAVDSAPDLIVERLTQFMARPSA
jgi:pimeloyl-ACP methyl ester carboxylesterase